MEDCFGRVPEWLIGAVLKTVVRDERTVGSNPTSSFSRKGLYIVGCVLTQHLFFKSQ